MDHEWEELQLYKNLTELVLHGLNLHRDQFFETNDVAALVRKSRDPVELDIDELYDSLLTEVARILVEIQKLNMADPEDRSALWLDQERTRVEEDVRSTYKRVDALTRTGELSAVAADSAPRLLTLPCRRLLGIFRYMPSGVVPIWMLLLHWDRPICHWSASVAF